MPTSSPTLVSVLFIASIVILCVQPDAGSCAPAESFPAGPRWGRMAPEEQARHRIDELLVRAGWEVQDLSGLNLYARKGVAVREVPLKSGHGEADYLLYVDGKAAGVVEAKPVGHTLTGVEVQSQKYG